MRGAGGMVKGEASQLQVQAVRWAGGAEAVSGTGAQERGRGRTDKGVSAGEGSVRCRGLVHKAWYQARTWGAVGGVGGAKRRPISCGTDHLASTRLGQEHGIQTQADGVQFQIRSQTGLYRRRRGQFLLVRHHVV